MRQVLRGIGIAVAFWIVSAGILVVLGGLLRVAALGRKMDFLVPHGGTEIILWIALSVTAGICGETIFRGYLQRQFMALTKSLPPAFSFLPPHPVPLMRTRASGW